LELRSEEILARCLKCVVRLKPYRRDAVLVLRAAALKTARKIPRLDGIFHTLRIAAVDILAEPRPRLLPQLLPLPLLLPELELKL